MKSEKLVKGSKSREQKRTTESTVGGEESAEGQNRWVCEICGHRPIHKLLSNRRTRKRNWEAQRPSTRQVSTREVHLQLELKKKWT